MGDDLANSAVLVRGGTAVVGASAMEVSKVQTITGMSDQDALLRLGPLRKVEIRPFKIDPWPVSAARFLAFVEVWKSLCDGGVRRVDAEYWNRYAVETPSLGIPVTGVTITEARAFAFFNGGRLPSEDEWEWAVKGHRQSGFISPLSEPNQADSAMAQEGPRHPSQDGEFGNWNLAWGLAEIVGDAPYVEVTASKMSYSSDLDAADFMRRLRSGCLVKPLRRSASVFHCALREFMDDPYSWGADGVVRIRYRPLTLATFRCVYDLE